MRTWHLRKGLRVPCLLPWGQPPLGVQRRPVLLFSSLPQQVPPACLCDVLCQSACLHIYLPCLQEIGVDMLPRVEPIEESTSTLRALTGGCAQGCCTCGKAGAGSWQVRVLGHESLLRPPLPSPLPPLLLQLLHWKAAGTSVEGRQWAFMLPVRARCDTLPSLA